MRSCKSLLVGGAAAALALMVVTGSVVALGANHENRLTFNRPVALPGVVLPAGTYSFNVADGTLDVVVVRNSAGTKQVYMGFTTTVGRPAGMSPNTLVTTGEAPANQTPPITRWYEIGQTIGHEFRY
jgi:hypothetical protein